MVAVEGKGSHSNVTQLRFSVDLFVNSIGSYGNNNFIFNSRAVCPSVIQRYMSIMLSLLACPVSLLLSVSDTSRIIVRLLQCLYKIVVVGYFWLFAYGYLTTLPLALSVQHWIVELFWKLHFCWTVELLLNKTLEILTSNFTSVVWPSLRRAGYEFKI
jgi:hypothetical protein